MRTRFEDGNLLRFWNKRHQEIAWIKLGLRGLELDIELPSEWHEDKRTWVHWSLGIISGGFSWNYKGKPFPDYGQCAGPRYGFQFHQEFLWWHWGQDTGSSGCRATKSFYMPWAWENVRHSFLKRDGSIDHHASRKEYTPGLELQTSYAYHYYLKDGSVQKRIATIYGDEMEWRLKWAPWLPWPRKIRRCIDVRFNEEVGERTGSWKGGVLGCGWEWRKNETQEQALRRMEATRKL